MLISISEYAQLHDRNPYTVQQKCARGGFKTAKKIGRNWVIDSEEPYGDNRRGPKTSLIKQGLLTQELESINGQSVRVNFQEFY